MNDLVRGAAAGTVGTVVMSAAMAAAKATVMIGDETPPRQVVRNLEEATGVREELDQPTFEASWVALHFAYGAAAGVAYEAAHRLVPLREPVRAGLAFGILLWAVGYGGWTPALGLTPPPHRERKRKVATEIVTHLIYGTTTAAVSRLLRGTASSR